MASRHLARSIAMQTLYEWDFKGTIGILVSEEDAILILERNIQEFGPGLEEKAFAKSIVTGVLTYRDDIDTIIEKAAPEWPIKQVAVVDRNVLRIGLFELIYGVYSEVPPRVAINESIELAKTFGGPNSGKFINGVLGTVYREIGEPGKDEKSHKDLTSAELAKLAIEEKVGAIVYQKNKEDIRFALVHDIFGYWTLAKGSPLENERLEDTALRKVFDEAGLGNSRVVEKLGENEYIAYDPEKGRVRRRVTYFLVETTDTKLTLKETGGLDDIKWFSADALQDLKMYDDVRGFFVKVFEIIK